MAKAQLYNADAWDSSKEHIFRFLWDGNQSFGNILQIRNNLTDTIVYEESETTMQLKHTVPANTLKNGTFFL